MPALIDFTSFLPQCCDVVHYQLVGQECAERGACYNDLRPLGAGYWFSIPYRLGWPLESLLILHLLLLLISVQLSARALTSRLSTVAGVHTAGVFQAGALWLASLLIHLVFLAPTIRNAITDAPASLFALIGCWLLLLAGQSPRRNLLLLTAGLTLGMAAWMRVFYVTPLMLLGGAWVILWLYSPQRRYGDLLLLSFLPIFVCQYISSWNHTQRIEYLPPNPGLVEWHLNSIPTGYDSVLPGHTYAWKGPCDHYRSVQEALQQRDARSLLCQAAGKLNFYLGSYSARTYWNPEQGEITGSFDATVTQSHNVQLTHENKVLHARKEDTTRDAELYQTLPTAEDFKYRLTLTAQTATPPQYLEIEIRDHNTGEVAHGGSVLLLDNTPQRGDLDRYLPMSGNKDFVIRLPHIAPDSELGQKAAALGITLQQNHVTLTDIAIHRMDLREQRHWSLWMLAANALALIGAFCFILCNKRHHQTTDWMVFLFWLAGAGMAFALAPEQRYAISVMITAWILFLHPLAVSFSRLSRQSDAANGHLTPPP